jgi:hypothetical protein
MLWNSAAEKNFVHFLHLKSFRHFAVWKVKQCRYFWPNKKIENQKQCAMKTKKNIIIAFSLTALISSSSQNIFSQLYFSDDFTCIEYRPAERVFVKETVVGSEEAVRLENLYSPSSNVISKLKEDSLQHLKLEIFSANKNYLKWYVQNDNIGGIYVIERSVNGTDFKPVGLKNRIASTIALPLMYSWIDEHPSDHLYYRILSIGEDGTYRYSSAVKTVKKNLQDQPKTLTQNIN